MVDDIAAQLEDVFKAEEPRPTAPPPPPPAPPPPPVSAAPAPPKPSPPAPAPKPAPRNPFDSLEEEMAKLLGRPIGDK
jgi:hypothetical protein